MSDQVPEELKYTKSHEWVRDEGDGTVTIGITIHAQDLLGDMVFVELPEQGSSVSAGDECCVVESVKAASDVFSPLSGEITEVNEQLAESPETVNSDPYGDGWIFKMRISEESELNKLLCAADYQTVADEEAH
ncbi:MAG: glycine cleavage system protein GcvH [Gammaproteobacteria bacterium]|nr:MAG: glycine cleavage system protein GcvH [Gammaproteobacteria bacterium]